MYLKTISIFEASFKHYTADSHSIAYPPFQRNNLYHIVEAQTRIKAGDEADRVDCLDVVKCIPCTLATDKLNAEVPKRQKSKFKEEIGVTALG